MAGNWTRLQRQLVGDYSFFRVRKDTNQSPRTQKEHDFFILELSEWINIIPVTPAGKVVLIWQYRHGIERVGLEIPGGVMESSDASPALAARRELSEETGYDTEIIIELGQVAPNPALQNNRCHSFLALGVRPLGVQELDDAEDIRVEEFELGEVPALIRAGRIHHSLVIFAFYLLDQYRLQNPGFELSQ